MTEIDTITPAPVVYVPARLVSIPVVLDTSRGIPELSRRCPTSQRTGYISLRYVPHNPKRMRDADVMTT